ncbi:hypothetical protein HZA41_03370 [Candidatus Peregrinibacteria bacterium]|nr:hypothetical protein [Candidatus Peregrinibacteria bacterium]
MKFEEIIHKIKNLEIQGAENVTMMAVQAFGLKLTETQDASQLEIYADKLRASRPTEPALRNALNFCLQNYTTLDVIQHVIDHFETSKEKIADFGAKKIENGMCVFTHCHSSTVVAILKKAFHDGKKFTVANTETRPLFQGRKTAKSLADEGIPVEHFIDSAGRLALKKADLFLFGCDAMTSEGKIINKIGTAPLLFFANKYSVPSYSCTNSWKFDPETLYGEEETIEERSASEVWENAPENVIIRNPAFEPVSPDDMTGIITELGVMKPEALIMEIKNTYPWLMRK